LGVPAILLQEILAVPQSGQNREFAL